jgi:prophage antirepressor-like protein
MNALVNFTFETEMVRVVMQDDEPWWVAGDVSAVLGYSEAAAMTRSLDDDEKGLQIVQTLGGQQEMTIISESGLFAAILKSRRPEAKRFRRWVTGEVLPSLRKTGRYDMLSDVPKLPSPAIEDAEMPRLNAAIGIMREARQIWSREECRHIWIRIGLPAPIADALSDTGFAHSVTDALAGKDMIEVGELSAALGLQADARNALRLGEVMRALGWEKTRQRLQGIPRWIWRRTAAATLVEQSL